MHGVRRRARWRGGRDWIRPRAHRHGDGEYSDPQARDVKQHDGLLAGQVSRLYEGSRTLGGLLTGPKSLGQIKSRPDRRSGILGPPGPASADRP